MTPITVELNNDEALILFAWLATLEFKSDSTQCDDAEQTVLWRVEGQLERQIVQVVSLEYVRELAEAKARVVAKR
jgi:hypothetical protein